VIFDGDSLTASSYPGVVMGNFPGEWISTNLGVGSRTLETMLDLAPTQLDTLFASSRESNIAVIWGGTNDLYFGGTAAAVIADIQSYGAGRKAAGFKVVVVGMLPRSNGGTPGSFETDRQTIRTSMLADFDTATAYSNVWKPATGTTYADIYIDLGGDTNIGDAGDEADTTYYDGGLVHMNSTGYAVVAGYVRNGINVLVPFH
jgi:lysophospholipase L1-like esterase